MGETSHEYKHGDMDIHEQVSTYSGFLALSKWGSLVLAALILFLTITFCVSGAGPIPGGIAAVVVLGLGWLLLRKSA